MRFAALALTILLASSATAQLPSLADQQAKLVAAKRDAAGAAARARELDKLAAAERTAAERAQAEEDALTARVAASAADLATAEARSAIVTGLLADRQAELGAAQAPAARLLAALESLARRPAIAVIAQPGSVDDLVHVRAVLGSALPKIRAETASVRTQVAATRRLQRNAALAATALRQGRATLESNRVALARLEADHRRKSQALGRNAIGESDRALALGEQARDLVDRMAETGNAQATAATLVALPGPDPRPLAPDATPPAPLRGVYRLPVAGRLVTGLGEISEAGVRSRGLTFAVAPGAPVVAPAAGTVRFARHFRDYGTIVILDHGDGWTTLVTGLSETVVTRGAHVAMGDPIGLAARRDEPRVTVELRRRGEPVDIASLAG
ncbi:murein hydrolase activator EnvC family protein [Sphingomonas oligophenolica]|uniref:Metalloendopeptidase n=1 Tax=Sphingomonas oligophenolica TaxID=301154 RepID=A0A502CCE7_9SPHN|nr:peptidoglycan DD-metalloendopeptidase family protein [Sphingomonas oligophenolica]TPG10382.1 metalloendopeptidase [Sphingomonas oligophenolica]